MARLGQIFLSIVGFHKLTLLNGCGLNSTLLFNEGNMADEMSVCSSHGHSCVADQQFRVDIGN